MTGSQTLGAVAGAVALLAAVAGGIVAHERAIGARDEQIKQLKGTIAQQAVTITADSQALVRVDTVKVFRQVVKSDTVLQRFIDTAFVHHHDSVFVPVQVLVESKATIDSTKKAADACCRLARDYQARAASLDTLNRDLLKKIPSSGKPWLDRGEGVLACAGAIWLAGKLKSP